MAVIVVVVAVVVVGVVVGFCAIDVLLGQVRMTRRKLLSVAGARCERKEWKVTYLRNKVHKNVCIASCCWHRFFCDIVGVLLGLVRRKYLSQKVRRLGRGEGVD